MDTLNIRSVLLVSRKFWASSKEVRYYNASKESGVKFIKGKMRQGKVRQGKARKEKKPANVSRYASGL